MSDPYYIYDEKAVKKTGFIGIGSVSGYTYKAIKLDETQAKAINQFVIDISAVSKDAVDFNKDQSLFHDLQAKYIAKGYNIYEQSDLVNAIKKEQVKLNKDQSKYLKDLKEAGPAIDYTSKKKLSNDHVNYLEPATVGQKQTLTK